MTTKAKVGDEVKGADLPEGWPESLEGLIGEIAEYEAISTDGLMGLAGEAYDNALERLREIAATPRELWDAPRAGFLEAEFLGWCMAVGRTMVTMWQRGCTWLPPDEPQVVEKEATHD
jgi:hypothetical protein